MAAPKRFFVENMQEDMMLPEQEARHARNVLRLSEGDEVTLFDGSGREYSAVVTRADRQGISVHVVREDISDRIVYISQGKILAACPLKELLDQYKVAHFSSLADATVANAIGVKSVKDGYEGLLLCDTQRLNGVILSDATIDNIIVHLEKANMEERYG